MAFVAAMEKFFATHLGGRYQSEMPKEISKRLKEITVDVSKVELPEEMEANSLFDVPPTPAQSLKATVDNYKVSIDLAGQKMDMDMTTTIEDAGSSWKISDNLTSPMGNMIDVTMVDKKSLQPITRDVQQGPLVMKIEYSKEEITGSISAEGQVENVKEEIHGAMFAEGAGSKNILACLPLKEGYSTSFRNFDMKSKEVKVMKLKVLTKESITVDAGTFDTFKLELKPANGDPGSTTIWVSADNKRKAVKTSSIVPSLNGAIMTSELQKS